MCNLENVIDSDAARSRIDQEIAHLFERTRKLQSERNELAPISKLPPEIFGTIFSFVSAGRSRLFPCYYFTHVSRSWRSMALGMPTLWRILPRNVQWANFMLERSKGTDLAVGWVLDYNGVSISSQTTPRVFESST